MHRYHLPHLFQLISPVLRRQHRPIQLACQIQPIVSRYHHPRLFQLILPILQRQHYPALLTYQTQLIASQYHFLLKRLDHLFLYLHLNPPTNCLNHLLVQQNLGLQLACHLIQPVDCRDHRHLQEVQDQNLDLPSPLPINHLMRSLPHLLFLFLFH